MNWGDEMPHPAAILLFIALIFPVALWFERRDRKRAETDANELFKMVLSLEQENSEILADNAILLAAAAKEADRHNMSAYQRLYHDIVNEPPRTTGRVRDVAFQTGLPRGSVPAIEVQAHCPEEAIEVLWAKYLTGMRAA